MNVTVPVGVPPLEVIVAVMVSDWPNVDGLGVTTTDVEVVIGTGFTVRVTVPELFANPPEPVKFAEIV